MHQRAFSKSPADDASATASATATKTTTKTATKTTTLAELALGGRARVRRVRAAVDGDAGDLSLRLMEMGFVPGTLVTLVKRAPLGDPLELRVRGGHVSLRRAEARLVEVELLASEAGA